MATKAFELTRLDANTFEHMVNALAQRTLGMGVTGFAQGPDAGRDGLFEGEADYPSSAERWRGTWYIQSKFRSPSSSGNDQAWLVQQIRNELSEFLDAENGRKLPDNWIIATNIDPTAKAKTGSHDKIIAAVAAVSPKLARRTHIWGGTKLLSLLTLHSDVARHYGGLLTSGDLISSVINAIGDTSAGIDAIIRNLVVSQMAEQQYTKLEQAGSSADTRPGIQTLFVDLPFHHENNRFPGTLQQLTKALADNHAPTIDRPQGPVWEKWKREPSRSRIWFLRGGPGNGKSTITQFVCQIHRAALLRASKNHIVNDRLRTLSLDICNKAEKHGFLPHCARIPIHMELRLYAHWYGQQRPQSSKGVLSYLCSRIGKDLEQKLHVGTLKRALECGRWLIVFDGLDEVPGDVKDSLAKEINMFVDDVLLECKCDAMIICTSRPQGYSGQFDEIRPTVIDLAKLTTQEALACADPVLSIDRTQEEVELYRSTLVEATNSPSICEIMTTPLQSHIMAVVVRDGGRPPERKWQLFSNFYQVIKKREANRNLADPRISRLLREGDKLIKALHNRLGFELHFRAEKSSGAQTSINKDDLKHIISEIVHNLQDENVEETISLLLEATTERLVLVNTPENSSAVRFDIRPLQEFFAAEYLYETANEAGFRDRVAAIAKDSHWREVMHFLLSALIEQERRGELALAVEILSELDDEPADQRRALARRLGIGGLLATRLLREGVLESDKRTRALFRKCFGSLLAGTDACSLLSSSPPPHSATWLIGVGLDALNELNPQENIGAASLMPIIVSDSSTQLDRVTNYLKDSDANFFAAFSNRISNHFVRGDRSSIPIWVMRLLLKRVLRSDWSDLPNSTLDQIYVLLATNKNRFLQAARLEGISPDVSDLLFGFFDHHDRSELGKSIEENVIGGVIHESVHGIPSALREFKWSKEIIEELECLGGVARACVLLYRGAFLRLDQDLDILTAEIGPKGGISLLPDSYVYLICDRFEEFSNRSIKECIRTDRLGQRIDYMIYRHDGEDTDWEAVIQRFPHIGFSYLRNEREESDRRSFLNWARIDSNLDFFVKSVASSQSYSLGLPGLCRFVELFPSKAEDMKQIFGSGPITRSVYSSSVIDKFIQFDLSTDSYILPHLAAYVNSSRELPEFFAHRPSVGDLILQIPQFLPDLQSLEEFWDSGPTTEADVAAAGLLLLAWQQSIPLGQKHLNRLLDCYNRSISEWFLPAALRFITSHVQREDAVALDFANSLLDLAREDLPGRCACEHIIADWREISHAPVHTISQSTIWNS